MSISFFHRAIASLRRVVFALRHGDGVCPREHPGTGAPVETPTEKSLRVSVEYKLGAIVLGVTVIALGVLGSILVDHVKRTEHERESAKLLEVSSGVRAMLAVNHRTMSADIEKHFAAFEAMLDAPATLETAADLDLGGHRVPQLKLGKQPVRTDFAAIDRFTNDVVGTIATIFVRHDDDFLRLATSLRDDVGQRAAGTRLGREHPAHRHLVRGDSYTGPARLFGRWYMTKYQPLRDPAGQIIGALFVGLDLSPVFARIAEEVRHIRINRNGYVYVVDTKPGETYGRLLIHPRLEGFNILEHPDADARGFFHQAIAGGDGTVGRYRFREPAGEVREKIVAIAEFPEWHWVIGASAYYDEFTAQGTRMQYVAVALLLAAALAIIVGLKLTIRRLVLAPLLKLHDTLRASESRFRTLVTSSDDLIYTTDAAGHLTAVFDKGLVLPPAGCDTLIGHPVEALLGNTDPQHATAHAEALGGAHTVYDWSVEGPTGHIDFQSSLSPMHDAHGRISGLVCIGRDITERRRAEALTSHLAQHDALTGLPNRTLMQDRLQQAILHAERHGNLVGLLFVDLDHFKDVNDQFGHETGDQLLQAVAGRLLGCVRQADTVARIGGDEFVVVVGDAAGHAPLVQVAEKLLAAFSEPFALPSRTLQMSASIGLSSYPADAGDAVQLIKVADAAMYQAKKAGRAGFCSTGMQA